MNRQQTWAYWYQEIKELPKVRLQNLATKNKPAMLEEASICFLSLKPND